MDTTQGEVPWFAVTVPATVNVPEPVTAPMVLPPAGSALAIEPIFQVPDCVAASVPLSTITCPMTAEPATIPTVPPVAPIAPVGSGSDAAEIGCVA